MIKPNVNSSANQKGNRKGLILLIVVIVLSLILVPLSFFPHLFSKSNEPITELDQPAEPITVLNCPYEGKIKITALEIKTVEIPELSVSGEVAVLVRFRIENTASEGEYMPSCEITADDAVVTDTWMWKMGLAGDEKAISSLDVLPGKHVEGYWGASVSRDAKSIEFQVRRSMLGEDAKYEYVSFVFDIPQIEDNTHSTADV